MILNDEQAAALRTALEPLQQWLEANANPHTYVHVTLHGAEVIEGVANLPRWIVKPIGDDELSLQESPLAPKCDSPWN